MPQAKFSLNYGSVLIMACVENVEILVLNLAAYM
jgi:hypothetical protein